MCACVSSVCICIICGQAAAVRRCFAGAHDDDVDARAARERERETNRNCEQEREEERKRLTQAEPRQLIAPEEEGSAARPMFMTLILPACFVKAAKKVKNVARLHKSK